MALGGSRFDDFDAPGAMIPPHPTHVSRTVGASRDVGEMVQGRTMTRVAGSAITLKSE